MGVVHDPTGTATRVKIEGLTIGGKTGTAQVVSRRLGFRRRRLSLEIPGSCLVCLYVARLKSRKLLLRYFWSMADMAARRQVRLPGRLWRPT